MPPVPAIEIRDLRVDYGNFVAVNDISLTVQPGDVCGLVGPNGAGKTSTFKVLTTLMYPTYGDVKLCGMDLFLQPEAARIVLGYMPDFAPVPSDLRAGEFLDLFAAAHGLGDAALHLEHFGLNDEGVSRQHGLAPLHVVRAHEVADLALVSGHAQEHDACHLGHGLEL